MYPCIFKQSRIVFKTEIHYEVVKRGEKMNFPEGTKFRDEVDPETGQKVKVAILPDGTELKFYTEENLESI